MTFENLKQRCVQEFCSKNTRDYNGQVNGSRQPALMAFALINEFKITGEWKKTRAFAKEIEDNCVKAIMNTDIRNIKPLIDLCPDSFPKWVKNGNYTVELTDKGWEFICKN